MTLVDLVAHRVSPLCAPSLVGEVLAVAFEIGAAVPVTDLLVGGEACSALWDDLAGQLTGRGWRSAVVWDESSPRLVLLPEGATSVDYDRCSAWWLTVEAYGDGTVNIHGAAPLAAADAEIDLRTFDTVADAVVALAADNAL